MTATALRPGSQLASTVCTTRVVVVRAPSANGPEITCGGAPMIAAPAGRPDTSGVKDPVTLIGKRYVDADDTVELLCTAPGIGELSANGVPMTVKAAKTLPASD